MHNMTLSSIMAPKKIAIFAAIKHFLNSLNDTIYA